MSGIQLPIGLLSSRLNLSDRFNGLRSQSFSSRFANMRPISEFFDVKRISKPANFGEVQSRISYNLGYFSSNYIAVFIMLSIYSLVTNLSLLFVILLVIGGTYGIGKLEGRDLNLGFVTATTSQLYTALVIITVPLGFWASPISSALWLIGATGVGGGLGGRPRTPYDSPQWGRPSGASRKGRNRRGLARAVVEDIDGYEYENDDGGYNDGNGVVRLAPGFKPISRANASSMYALRRRDTSNYDSDQDDMDDDGGVEYGITDANQDSTIAYAMELAMKDREDLLVEHALNKIRRAKAHGRPKIKLSHDELAALERRRLRTARESSQVPSYAVNSSPTPNISTLHTGGKDANDIGLSLSPESISTYSRSPTIQPSSISSKPKHRTPSTPQSYPYADSYHWAVPTSPMAPTAIPIPSTPQSPYSTYAYPALFANGYTPPESPQYGPSSPSVVYQPVYRSTSRNPFANYNPSDPFTLQQPAVQTPPYRSRTVSGSSSSDNAVKNKSRVGPGSSPTTSRGSARRTTLPMPSTTSVGPTRVRSASAATTGGAPSKSTSNGNTVRSRKKPSQPI
ncbi:hypothetical protein FQN57_007134 [Myotisia sp. PD_48]|nr:hypothetical protein FQN57_007134 [Myotisia sp. PD_48]